MPKKKTDLVPKKKNLPAQIDFKIDKNYSTGIDEKDVKIPLILLVHGQSKFPEFAQMENPPKEGEFYNPVTQQGFPAKFNALVVHSFTQAYTQMDDPDKKNRKKINRFASDGKHWNDTGEEIAETEFLWKDKKGNERDENEIARKRFQYVIIPEGTVDPCIIRFQKTSAKKARDMNYILYRTIPNWKYWTEFASAKETSNAGDEYLVTTGQVNRNLPLTDQTLADMALEIHNSYDNKVITVIEVDEDATENDNVPNYDETQEIKEEVKSSK